jgi:hypothetical protein
MRDVIDYDHRIVGQSQENDKFLVVKFYVDAIANDEKSREAGRLVCDEVEMVEMRVRGDRNNIVHKIVDEAIKRRFPGAYEAFKKGQEHRGSGTPLDQWPIVTRGMLEELKYMGFYTVEQVSEASDGVCAKFAGLQNLKQKAIAFIETAKNSTAPIEQLMAQMAELAGRMDAVQKANDVLRAENERLRDKAD